MNITLKIKIDDEIVLTDYYSKCIEFIKCITKKTVNEYCDSVFVEFNNTKDLEKTIDLINLQKTIPYEGFEDLVIDWDMSINIENIDSKDELFTNSLDHQTLDMVCSDLASEQETLKEKTDALYGFFEKSGVLQYKQMMRAFISVLEENKIIQSKQDIFDKIFTEQIH